MSDIDILDTNNFNHYDIPSGSVGNLPINRRIAFDRKALDALTKDTKATSNNIEKLIYDTRYAKDCNEGTKHLNQFYQLDSTEYDLAHYNPINDRRKLLGFAGLTLGGVGLGTGAGYLYSRLKGNKDKKARNRAMAIGAGAGGLLGSLMGYKYDPYSYRVESYLNDPTFANVQDTASKLGYPSSFDKFYDKWLDHISSLNDVSNYKDLIPNDPSIPALSNITETNQNKFNYANNLSKSIDLEARRLAAKKHDLAYLKSSAEAANATVNKANEAIAAYNANNPAVAMTKARNAQFRRWGNYGGGALGGLAGAATTGYFARNLLKSKNKKTRLLGAALIGAGGLGGAILGNRLGGYIGGNWAKTDGTSARELDPFKLYPTN